DHWEHRDSRSQRRMRIKNSHQRQPAAIGDTRNADPTIAGTEIVDQPIDRVPGIGSLINLAGIERAARRQVHYPTALGIVASANVFVDADIASTEECLIRNWERHCRMGTRS